ncbi:transglutaminase-like domain-containing protein [Myxococcota bacterium]|nr:transglutaminase-like domain-containing protein [Myxococcota bacterium]MBU1536635.1 transglutaminase-like domain-containing protein [Myxococcota bacterium]
MKKTHTALVFLAFFLLGCVSGEKKTPATPKPEHKRPVPVAPALQPLAVTGITPDAIDGYLAKAPMVFVPMKTIIAALPVIGKTSYTALYISGQKMGYSFDGWKLRKTDGKTYLVANESFHMEMKRGADVKKMHWEMERIYEGWGAGVLLKTVKTEKTEREVKLTSLTRTAAGEYRYHKESALLSNPGEGTRKTIVIKGTPERLTRSSLAVMALVAAKPVKGHRIWKVEKFDMDSGEASSDVVTLYGPGKATFSGRTYNGYRGSVISQKPHMAMNAFFSREGYLLRGSVGIIEIRVVSKEEAMKVGGLFDIMLKTYFPTKISTIKPSTRQLRISFAGSFPRGLRFLNTDRYKITYGKGETFSLILSLDDVSKATNAVPPKKLAPFLKSTTEIESDHPFIRALALKAVAGAKTRPQQVARLVAFVYKYIRKSMNHDLSSALLVAKARIGDCTEHTLLFTALARSLGIPARQVGGIGIVSAGSGHIFGYHAWPQVWLGRWIDVDPTWGQYPADVSHIMMGEDNDLRWIQLIGRLKILSSKVTQ